MSSFLGFRKPGGWITSRRIREREQKEEDEAREAKFRKWLPLVGSWFKAPLWKGDDDGADRSFIPCPKITFLVGTPPKLTCNICMVTDLRFQASTDVLSRDRRGDFRDCVPAISPCGHYAGAKCMRRWLLSNKTCPFCRTRLVYSKCGHQVPAKYITSDYIHTIPATVPDGGVVPDLCPKCYEARLWKTATAQSQRQNVRLRYAMEEFAARAEQKDADHMLRCKEEFQGFMMKEYYSKVAVRELVDW